MIANGVNADSIGELAAECGFYIADRRLLAGQDAQFEPVPPQLGDRIKELLQKQYPRGLYRHQSRAISEALQGRDICLATSTASGKSLVFMTVAWSILMRDPRAKILALYPVRALIQDQMAKWRSMLEAEGAQIGFIDGGVPIEQRKNILARSHVVLMTPDVAHAWLLGNVAHPYCNLFLRRIRLLVLDEAHVYDGVFGTNMAYFLRRLRAFTENHRIICSTATVGEPSDFMEKLVGRPMQIFDVANDTSARPQKSVLLCRSAGGSPFDNTVQLLTKLAGHEKNRYLAFGDSRKMVERIVAATLRQRKDASPEPDVEEEIGEDEDEESRRSVETLSLPKILPYRAGYEAEDRKEIQNALAQGGLAGVVSTSALELGLDIGEINIVVLLNTPPTVKAFHQRLGRAGRRNPAVCLVLDDYGGIRTLHQYFSRQMERGWLYLENRYIQYANALCAARELSAIGRKDVPRETFDSLPEGFIKVLENELNPTEAVPPDLYPLKQRAAGGSPQHEFPIRSQMETEFRVATFPGMPLGTLSLSQALREAYPGAVYYYMARPYRVRRFAYRSGEIKVVRAKHWTTRPIAQSMVFPKFRGGVMYLAHSDTAFLAEVELQVSERVLGFEESRGPNRTRYDYGPDSEFYPSPISRFFLTTGVCWYFPDHRLMSEVVASAIQDAFCSLCGVQDRDLGIGMFHARESPLGRSPCQGMCIYDSTNGSLRLTQQLAQRFAEVLGFAFDLQDPRDNGDVPGLLQELRQLVMALEPPPPQAAPLKTVSADGDWAITIAPGQPAMYRNNEGCQEVEVVGHRYTPRGLMLQLRPQKEGAIWLVSANHIEPLNGITKLARLNLVTGTLESADS